MIEAMSVKKLMDMLGDVPGDCLVRLYTEGAWSPCLSLSDVEGCDDTMDGYDKCVYLSDKEAKRC